MNLTNAQVRAFSTKLAHWHTHHNSRDLPWKGEKDPYKIWLSEIILQQTRALQGLPYYMAFTLAYPTVKHLAAAADEAVFRLWQGLGYYNRCKNMLATARYIANDLNGQFPQTYDDILALKGIGPYTAAAIASFAYGLPNAVVDGNVYRVLARYFGIDTPFDTTTGKQLFASLAQQLLDEARSAAHNQAMMDLGATVCTPANPICNECPLAGKCYAKAHNMTELLPVRSKKIKVKDRYFNYILLIASEKVWIQKRGSGDIWENLHQPYLIETDTYANMEQLQQDELFTHHAVREAGLVFAGSGKQRLTHQHIHATLYIMQLSDVVTIDTSIGMWLSISELKKLAFPKTLVSFLRNYLYF